MNDSKLLKQIGELIDTKLKPLKKQVDTVEMKVEVVNNRVEQSEKRLSKIIEKSQEDTIEALSSLIHNGYNTHEERIVNIEQHLNLIPSQSK